MEANAKLRKMGMPADDDEPEVFIGDIRKAEDLRFSSRVVLSVLSLPALSV